MKSLVWVAMGMGGWASAPVWAADEPRSLPQILKDLDGVRIPDYDFKKRGDQAYTREFPARRQQATERRNALILEAFRAAPDDDRIPGLMAERWSIRQFGLTADELQHELNDILARATNRRLKLEAVFAKDYATIYDSRPGDPTEAALEEFGKVAPGDPRNLALLWLAINRAIDGKSKLALEDRLIRAYPGSSQAKIIVGIRQKDDGLGKPFDLVFVDAISGQAISLERLKGKVVVIDFWATWCVPCIQDMPRMKDLYSKYHDRGAEFIGVSLDRPQDQGGLDALKKFVEAERIPWPQYYQGQGWESDFSVSCGISSIPALFVIDAQGKLASTNARGELDALLGELLGKGEARGCYGLHALKTGAAWRSMSMPKAT